MSSTHRSNPLDRLRLWQKFLLLGLFAALAAVVPTYNMISKAQEGISFARDEQHGVPPSVAMLEVIHLVQQHRGLAATLLSGNESATQQRASKESEVNQAFVKAEQLLAPEFERSALLKERWVRLQQAWKNIVAGVTARSVEAGASIQSHADLVESTIVFVELIADHFKLSLDPYAHTYFLIQAVTVHFPRMSEAFAMARALGSVRLNEASRLRAAGQDAGKALTEADRQRMQTLLAAARDSADAGFRFIEKAAREEPRIRAQLESDLVLPREASRQMLQLAQRDLVDATGTVADAAAFNKTMSEGIDTQFKFLAASSQTLQQELDQVVATLRREQLTMSAQVLAAFAAAGLLGWLTVRNVRSTVEGLQRSVDKVRAGEATELPQIAARDEVGDLGRTVNQLLGERLEAQHRAEAENERLNNSVIQILHAVNQLSQRDLTVRAPVTEDVIGTVSDSINALTEETSRVLMGVSELATQVETASGEVRSKAELVSKTAEDERAGVERMIDALADAAQTMNQVAALAEQSNVAAEQATQVTHTALETVDGTVRGMESIRETIAETEKRIKRLGERSQEISGIVNLINTISERTHVLALNASMQAAVAGDAGRGFAVVAEEVQRLAESSRNATQQIGTLVSNIQLETNETISTVNRTIGQVVQGSELAQRAGEQMRRTQEITAQLVAQVQRIGDASESQKSMSAELLNAVQRIGQSTERTAEQIEAQNAETATLLQSARRLVESVNVFKLPQAA